MINSEHVASPVMQHTEDQNTEKRGVTREEKKGMRRLEEEEEEEDEEGDKEARGGEET